MSPAVLSSLADLFDGLIAQVEDSRGQLLVGLISLDLEAAAQGKSWVQESEPRVVLLERLLRRRHQYGEAGQCMSPEELEEERIALAPQAGKDPCLGALEADAARLELDGPRLGLPAAPGLAALLRGQGTAA